MKIQFIKNKLYSTGGGSKITSHMPKVKKKLSTKRLKS